MAKRTGLGQQVLLSGVALSNDIRAASWAVPHATLDVTGVDKSAPERLLAQKAGDLTVTASFNPAAGRAHPTLGALPTTDQLVSYQVGTTRGDPVANLVGRQVNYDGARDQAGDLVFTSQFVGDGYPIEWGRQLTAGQDLQGGAAATAGVDFAASTNFGLQAWLHVLLFVGTSATVTIQESSDNGAGDAYANVAGGAFAAASAVGWQRIQTSRTLTVERWLRANVTGTYSALLFALHVEKNTVRVDF